MTSEHAEPEKLAAILPEPLGATAPPDAHSAEDREHIRKLMFYFGLVYVVEGMCQINQSTGIIAQPLNYYLKEVHGFTPVQLTAFLTVFTFPWIIKPIYGLVSDFVPLFGYRRKSYLILANALAAVAYLTATLLGVPSQLLFVLLLTAYAMAISSTLCGALLVENGQRYTASGAFVNQQWLWFNIAAMSAAVIGGQLVQHLSPTSAMHAAALIAAVAPLLVVVGTWRLIDEERTRIDLPQLKAGFRSLVTAFRTRTLWIVAFFLFFYYFSPGFNTPLYYYMTDTLKFSQGYIGMLNAILSGGSVAGALFYRRFMTDMTSKTLLRISIVLGTISILLFLGLVNEATAAILNFCYGFAQMIALVATLTLAADYCPKRSEGFAFAALMSVSNFAGAASDNVGSFLYEHVFANRLTPLILVSAAVTLLAWVLIPMLRLGDKPQGQAAHG